VPARWQATSIGDLVQEGARERQEPVGVREVAGEAERHAHGSPARHPKGGEQPIERLRRLACEARRDRFLSDP
jgi:hypothetical protein